MARSKAFTRLPGRHTTSASLLISASRARRGGSAAWGSGAERAKASLIRASVGAGR